VEKLFKISGSSTKDYIRPTRGSFGMKPEHIFKDKKQTIKNKLLKVMKYMGSKNRIAKEILPIMLKERGQRIWVEPFVGGANMIDKVPGEKIGADNQKYIISLFKALQNNWQPPKEVTEEYFHLVKNNKDKYQKELVGYLGTQLTFGCEWWGSFRRDNTGKRNYGTEAYNNVMRQQPNIKDIEFICSDYRDLEIPNGSLIYCDPPYRGVRKYVGNDKFDSDIFWEVCRNWSKQGHIVFVSEYTAPSDFECIWSKEISASANNSIKKGQGLKAVEKLFKFSPR
jgi:DNA adenine methylase